MALIATDLLVINRGGVDYKAPASELPEFDSSALETLIQANADNIASNADAISKLKLGSLTDVNAIGSTNQVLTQLADGSFGLATIAIPEALHPKGFINVENAAPADPAHGDIYIQHKDDQSSAIADASFTGISGKTIKEGTFVIFGVDDYWHAGGNAVSTSETPDLQTVINEGGVFTNGTITAKSPNANYAMEDTCFIGIDTATLSEESGDGHDLSSVRGIQLLKKDKGLFNQTVKILTNGNAYFENSVESAEFIGDGSKLTGVMPLDLRTLPALS